MTNLDLADVARRAPALEAMLAGRRVALVQEWISARAGSEKVFEALAALVPSADLYALSLHPGVQLETAGRPVHTSVLDHRLLRDHRDRTLLLMPLVWRSMARRRDYDVVITSSHCFSRVFAMGRDTLHLSYVHSPMRYLWYPELDERTSSRLYRMSRHGRGVLKRIDLATARRTDGFAVNSRTVGARVRDTYGRDAVVIHPPVATSFFAEAPVRPRTRLVALSRFVPYKRLDDAIRVAAALGESLVVAGEGPLEGELRALAGLLRADVEFRIRPSDAEVRDLFAEAKTTLFFANEDFGIVPVEAQAAGSPVVTAGEGGALETVLDGVTGHHAATPTLDDLVDATVRTLRATLDPAACRAHARTFSYAAFADAAASWITRDVGAG